jgi:sortase (surface protein transpeptidase)
VTGGSPWQGDPPVGRALEPWFFWYEDTEAADGKPAQRPGPDSGHRGSRARLVRRPVAAAALLAGLLAIVGGTVGLTRLTSHPGDIARPLPKASPPPFGTFAAPPAARSTGQVARPAALTIPAIGVRTPLERLERTPQGTLQVPVSTTEAGWYAGSPRPGEIGSSIIVGHIDSDQGPGVFFRLRLLRPGALVYVRRSDGTLVVFRVYAERMYRKDLFPTERVYGPTPDAELHLITCGGVFDQATGSYLANVVVYATQISVHRARHHHARQHGHQPRARHS